MDLITKLKKIIGIDFKYFILTGCFSIITMSIVFTTPIIIGFTVDYIVMGNTTNDFVNNIINFFGGAYYISSNLWIPFLLIVGLSTIRIIFVHFIIKYNGIGSENIAKRMRNNLYNHIQRLPYDYHVKAKTGDLIQRCTSDIENIRMFLSNQLIELMRTTIMGFIVFFILINLNLQLAIFSLVLLPVIFIFSYIFHSKIQKSFNIQEEMESALFSTIQENLSGIRVVRAFGRSKFEMDKFNEKNRKFRDTSRNLFKIRAFYWGTSDFLCMMQLFIVIIIGVNLTFNGIITLGIFMIFLTYINNFIWPIRNMARIIADMGRMSISFDRINEILEMPLEIDTENAVDIDLNSDIIFENVSFGYDETKNILDGMSFQIKKGETIAILGRAGSGKSTLMHIFLRLYDYKSGSIKINGVELRNIKKETLRKKIGIVLQDSYLYSRTIKENLKMSKTNLKIEEMTNATKISKIHDTIEAFRNKYETVLGERGVTLSGGQRQRLAISRTIIKNSDILIFDDSLSAVDTDTDSQIRNALRQRKKDTTTIIISGRITTLKEADRIFIMENGKISDIGTHDELIKKETLYKKIWDIQTSLEDELEAV
ncbi:MAG: ABC transporter ATP-binding protein/permease [Defluviitaleaceae bacterium]|nr:ABC transporter ATP-binding protein/permease [Defluviitaleaceae bacterium]